MAWLFPTPVHTRSKVSGPHSIKHSKNSSVTTCSAALGGDTDLDRLRPRGCCRGLPKPSGNEFGVHLARSTGKPVAHAMMSAIVFQTFGSLFGYTQSISNSRGIWDICGKIRSAVLDRFYGCDFNIQSTTRRHDLNYCKLDAKLDSSHMAMR
jgi:hypothetical protein